MKTPTILRRKRTGQTDYRKRLTLLKSETPRLVARISRSGFIVQITEYDPDGDLVRATVNSRVMEKSVGIKGNNTQVCYLAGYLLGKKAQTMELENAILDTGRQELVRGGRVSAMLKGAVDSGLEVACSEEIFPKKDRIQGKHLKNPLKVEELKKKIDEMVK